MKQVTITTDGACDPNPGPGGWAAILRSGEKVREIYGSEAQTTNNRMETRAIIEGLRALTQPCEVLIRTDSKIATSWCRGGQFTKEKHRLEKPEAYALHLAYGEAAKRHVVTFEWVKGHAGDPDNERADLLAERACRTPGMAAVVKQPIMVVPQAPVVKTVEAASSPTKIRLTRENLHQLSGSPSQDGFTKKQLALLGFPWPPPKGWLTNLIGTEIDRALYDRVGLAISAKRLKEKSQARLVL
jgi:ribonuclease HI